MSTPRDCYYKMLRRPAPEKAPRAHSEAGETLIEVLLALIILAMASVALITAFGADIKASAEHRILANFDTAEASAIATTTSLIQQQYAGVFSTCPATPLAGYPSSAVLTAALNIPNYTASIASSGSLPAVEYSSGSGFTANCSIGANGDVGDPQLINIVVTDTVTGYSQSNAIVATLPEPVQIGGGGGSTAANLDFVTQPEGATVDAPFTTQPIIEVMDGGSGGNPPKIVTTDLSPITVTLAGGTVGASLSPDCSGVETSGIVVFSGCSINEVGTGYQLVASEPSPTEPGQLLSSNSAPFSVYAGQLGTPKITSVTPSTVTAGAINVSFTEPGTPPPGQTYSIKACTNSAMSANCSTQTSFASGSDLTGLVQGTNYWVQITATSSSSFLASTSPTSGPTMATVQLAAPGAPLLGYGTTAGSLSVNFTGSPGAQSYTVKACTITAMTGNSCVSNTNFTPGGSLTGLFYTPGSAGAAYYVQVLANASTGYLASPPSPTMPTVSHAATSQVKTPTGFSVAPSVSKVGAITASFTESGGVGITAPSSFTATACTDVGMSANCVTVPNYSSGAQISGLTPGTGYYVQITAVSSTVGFVSSTTPVSAPTVATAQLAAPTNMNASYGTVTGSISVSFTAPPIVAADQTYTAEACTNASMKTGCFTNPNYTSGADFAVSKPPVGAVGTTYFVQVTANGSSGYLVSPASAQVSQAALSEIGAPGTPTALTSTTTTGAIVVSFASPSGTAPSSYTAKACTDTNMSNNCVSVANYTSGVTQLSGLQSGTKYYVQVVAIGPMGFASNSSPVSTNWTRAK
jgi:hypothetical protein